MPHDNATLRRHWPLPAILLATFILRGLELRGRDFRSYLSLLPDTEYYTAPWWKLLLPFHVGDGFMSWTATGLVLTTWLDRLLGTKLDFVLLSLLLVAVSYASSWSVFRSRAFSATLALLMGLGSQLTYAYVIPSLVKYFLFLSFLQINLACLLLAVRDDGAEPPRAWLAPAFAASLVALALNSEVWLDYALFLLAALCYLWWRRGYRRSPGRLLGTTVAVVVLYLGVRIFFVGEHFVYGKEGEVVFKYLFPLENGEVRFRPSLAILAFEDVVSNFFTYLYLAFSNFFPPPLVASNSLVLFGKGRILAEQYGYHASQTELVYYHHLFYWYFAAGVVAACFVAGLVASIRSDGRSQSAAVPILTVLLLLVLCGFFTHSVIKYRPYLSSPVFTYKAIVSVVGVAWLIAYGMLQLRRRATRATFVLVAALVVATIGWNAMARPSVLSKLSVAVGMAEFPDPLVNLRRVLRR